MFKVEPALVDWVEKQVLLKGWFEAILSISKIKFELPFVTICLKWITKFCPQKRLETCLKKEFNKEVDWFQRTKQTIIPLQSM